MVDILQERLFLVGCGDQMDEEATAQFHALLLFLNAVINHTLDCLWYEDVRTSFASREGQARKCKLIFTDVVELHIYSGPIYRQPSRARAMSPSLAAKACTAINSMAIHHGQTKVLAESPPTPVIL
jgi:hypothetical protein